MYLFAGKFSHVDGYADDELWTVIFPDSIQTGNRAIVIAQWTQAADGKRKARMQANGKITKAEGSGEIDIDIFEDDSTIYYWYRGTVNSTKDRITLTMNNPRNEYCGSVDAEIVYTTDS